jgi:transcription termination factor Rho
MDEVIFEEFKGTGNMEVHLDRHLVDRRIFPTVNIEVSGTRKEELLYHPDEYSKVVVLRRALTGVPSVEAMELMLNKLKKTGSNIEFLLGMGGV